MRPNSAQVRSEKALWPRVYESFFALCSRMIASFEVNASSAFASSSTVL